MGETGPKNTHSSSSHLARQTGKRQAKHFPHVFRQNNKNNMTEFLVATGPHASAPHPLELQTGGEKGHEEVMPEDSQKM